MAYIKVKGKTYGIHAGSRGGRYWIDEDGKKHYIKSMAAALKSAPENNKPKETPKPAPKPVVQKPKYEEPKLRSWLGYFYELNSDGERIDDFKEWVEAYTKEEAREKFEHDYRHSITEGRIELDDVVLMRD